MRLFRHGVSWAGLAAGPTAWALSTQTNYAIASWPAVQSTYLVMTIAVVLVLVALAGAFLSWRARGETRRPDALVEQANGRPHEFLAGIGTFSGLLFAVVIALQGIASFLVEG
ncbi:MAG TPA: hypothetical protein VHA77_16905 [Xanthobacteraceae bacterium]|jgi:hypothetical protein|nr:hypothetical protein [Xanthobacteraceae bacterium]